jgi:DNA-binding transcriptional LysR family regulator
MELQRLRYFVTVAEEASITRAAHRLAMAQPPLSVQIRRLERELGTALFTRTGQGVALTEAGRAFLPHAREALAQAREGAEAARSVAEGQRGRLALGYMIGLAYDMMPRMVAHLRERLPGVELDLVELTVASRKAALLDRQVLLALCMPALSHPEIETALLQRQRLVVAMPAAHTLARLRAVPPARLQGHRLIELPQGSEEPGAISIARSMLRQQGVTMPASRAVGTVHSALGLVLAGEGLAILPEGILRLRPQGIAFRSLSGVTQRMDVVLCWRRDARNALLDRALAAIRDEPDFWAGELLG